MWSEIVLERCVESHIRASRLAIALTDIRLGKARFQRHTYQHSKSSWVYGMSSKNCL
jgi:hypothetical protein